MSSKKQRRKQLARAKWERQRQRQAARARRARRRNAIIAGTLVVVVAAGGSALAALSGGGGTDSQAADEPGEETGTESSAPPEDPCAAPAEGEPSGEQWDEEPEMSIDESADYVMSLQTTCGDIEITMDAEAAPRTVNSFHFLAGEGYFDHTTCHRLTTSGIFVLQCGDPEGTGQGGPGYELPDENLDDPDIAAETYPAGTVAMANSGPDTGGSQFFLVYQDSPLPPDYTPFGEITAGMDVLETIAGAGSTEPDPQTGNTAPHATVVIEEARVAEAAAD